MAPRIEIHEIAARDIHIGDKLSQNGAAGLDHWYDTADAGEDITVTGVVIDHVHDTVEVMTDADYFPLTPLADIRVAVTRPWSPSL
jgi:hypothetical protein